MRITDFGGDVITKTVINAMIEKSNVLSIAEFYKMVGNADSTRKVSSASGGQFRSVDSDYGDNTVTPEFATPTLKIFGDKVQTDRAHERRGSDIASVRAADLISFAYGLGREFQKTFFKGDSAENPTQFDGLRNIVDENQVLTPYENGLGIALGNTDAVKKTQQQFLEALDVLIQSVDGGAQAISMDGALLGRLSSIARDQVNYQLNEFGQQIPYYNGIPILPAGYDNAGARILAFNETVGTATTKCTSVYAYRFGERENLTFATNVGVEVKDLGLVGVHYTFSVDFDLAPALLNSRAIAQLKGMYLG